MIARVLGCSGRIITRAWLLILAVLILCMLDAEPAVGILKTASKATPAIAGVFLLLSMVFVLRSFCGMRIRSNAS